MNEIYNLALEIATKAHDGQFREDGETPYIEHPERVADIASLWYGDFTWSKLNSYELFNTDKYKLWEIINRAQENCTIIKYFDAIIRSIGLLHDVIEDTKISELDLRREGEKLVFKSDKTFWEECVIPTVVCLTRDKTKESYCEFIVRVSKNPLAVLIKLADIEHNLSDLKQGARRDKYELACHLLLNKN